MFNGSSLHRFLHRLFHVEKYSNFQLKMPLPYFTHGVQTYSSPLPLRASDDADLLLVCCHSSHAAVNITSQHSSNCKYGSRKTTYGRRWAEPVCGRIPCSVVRTDRLRSSPTREQRIVQSPPDRPRRSHVDRGAYWLCIETARKLRDWPTCVTGPSALVQRTATPDSRRLPLEEDSPAASAR